MFRDFAPKTGYFFKKFLENFKKMDPCLGILGPKMGPMFRDFCQKPTHLGGTSPYSVSMGVPPGGLPGITMRRLCIANI